MADRAPRDYSAMYTDHACVVCGGFCCAASAPLHVKRHLAAGEAVVVKAFGQPDKVVPTSSIPDEPDPKPPVPRDASPVPLTPARITQLTRKHLRAYRGASYRPKP